MLNLSLHAPTEPFWVAFPRHEVRVLVRPLTIAVLAAITSYAGQQIAAMATERLERVASNVPVGDLPDWTDEHVRTGHSRELTAIGMARYGIVAWEGVGDHDGNPLPVTADNAARFARAIGLDFVREYERTLSALAAEGNASGAGPHGASAPTAPTATVATQVH